jgi:hypothetical protein
MAIFKPAWYFNKGPAGSREGFAQRVTALIGHITKIVADPESRTAT